jgi:hypothetical protein
VATSRLQQVARYSDSTGARLGERLAAVELLSLLRPPVAIAFFVSFTALALHEHPQWRDRVGSHGNAADREAFVHELRRLYPFVPALAAKARTSFEWNGFRLRRGQRIVLDVLGTDHHPERWPDPGSFDPERFLRTPPSAFDFVPQGGGEPVQGHRCRVTPAPSPSSACAPAGWPTSTTTCVPRTPASRWSGCPRGRCPAPRCVPCGLGPARCAGPRAWRRRPVSPDGRRVSLMRGQSGRAVSQPGGR